MSESSQTPQASDAPRELDRREALAWIARATAAGVVLSCACGDEAHAEEQGGKPAKAPSFNDLKVGVAVDSGNGYFLTKTEKGVAALPKVCTHKGKPLGVDKDGHIFCAAHGSKFDLDGKVAKGPAKDPLKPFKITVGADGALTIDTTANVDSGTWATPPAK